MRVQFSLHLDHHLLRAYNLLSRLQGEVVPALVQGNDGLQVLLRALVDQGQTLLHPEFTHVVLLDLLPRELHDEVQVGGEEAHPDLVVGECVHLEADQLLVAHVHEFGLDGGLGLVDHEV